MRDGRIGLSAARHLIESTSHLDDDIRSAVEAKMLVNCHDQSLPNFKRATRRWLEKKDPGFTKRAKAARAECVVAHDAVGNGVGELFIRGPLEITTQISMALTAHAAKTRDMLGGTAAQRKLAGLRDMTEDYLGSPGAAKHHGRLPIVNVTIDLATLLGLRDGVAEIPGVGAIPAEAARWLLADGAPLRRLVIDPLNGHLLDLGTAYTVSPALAEYLCAVNITAATPHSNVESRTADMEHNIPHGQRRDGTGGGATDRINVTPADRRWHRGKTFTDWTYIKDPDSCVVTWTSPTGLTYDIHPYDYRADP